MLRLPDRPAYLRSSRVLSVPRQERLCEAGETSTEVEERLRTRLVCLHVAEHVDAEIQRYEGERQVAWRSQQPHRRAAEQLLDLVLDHRDPRLDARGYLGPEFRVGYTAADHLA